MSLITPLGIDGRAFLGILAIDSSPLSLNQSHIDRLLFMNISSTLTIDLSTADSSIPVGAEIQLIRLSNPGNGQINVIPGAGVNLRTPNRVLTGTQTYSLTETGCITSLIKTTSNSWGLITNDGQRNILWHLRNDTTSATYTLDIADINNILCRTAAGTTTITLSSANSAIPVGSQFCFAPTAVGAVIRLAAGSGNTLFVSGRGWNLFDLDTPEITSILTKVTSTFWRLETQNASPQVLTSTSDSNAILLANNWANFAGTNIRCIGDLKLFTLSLQRSAAATSDQLIATIPIGVRPRSEISFPLLIGTTTIGQARLQPSGDFRYFGNSGFPNNSISASVSYL